MKISQNIHDFYALTRNYKAPYLPSSLIIHEKVERKLSTTLWGMDSMAAQLKFVCPRISQYHNHYHYVCQPMGSRIQPVNCTFWPITELQKAFNLPPCKIFKVCKPSSKYCKVGLTNQGIRMNLENKSLLYHKSL